MIIQLDQQTMTFSQRFGFQSPADSMNGGLRSIELDRRGPRKSICVGHTEPRNIARRLAPKQRNLIVKEEREMSVSATSIAFISNLHRFVVVDINQNAALLRSSKKSLLICSSSSSAAAPGVDLNLLQSALDKKDSDAVKEALDQLSESGWARQWSSQPYVSRRPTSLRELTTLGMKNAESLAIPSVRNDAAFLFTVVGTTGFLGVLAGQLPGDWGFFVPYLIGSISLVVLAVGSISPGLLQAAIGGFSTIFPDYQDRIARHEAAHFLVAYLLGLPIVDYSLDIGKEHVNLINDKLEKLIYSGQLDTKELDRLAVVAMAGLASEGLTYDKVVGQSADLFTLQRFINRSKPQLSKDQQQNLTRWAVLFSGSLLKNNKTVHEALIAAMSNKATVLECIKTIETAGST